MPILPASGPVAPDLATFERYAAEGYARLPAEVRKVCADLVIRVVDFPPDEMLVDLGVEDPFELTGLYEGVALTERSVMDQPSGPDVVWLFRRPILDEWAERGDVPLDALITHVLVHEIAHHLGWTDDDILAVDDWRA